MGITVPSIVMSEFYIGGMPVAHLSLEDSGSKVLWDSGILPQHFMASQPKRPKILHVIWHSERMLSGVAVAVSSSECTIPPPLQNDDHASLCGNRT